MKKTLILSSIIFYLLINSSCKKENIESDAHCVLGYGIEIYLLKEFAMVEGKCKIDNSTIIKENTPLVYNAEIEFYDLSKHSMGLKETAINRVKEAEDWDAFCITLNKTLIYSGFFKPGYSSSSCDHSVTIDPLSFSGQKIFFKLGYPWSTLEYFDGEDPRNDANLIQAFRTQGKLRE